MKKLLLFFVLVFNFRTSISAPINFQDTDAINPIRIVKNKDIKKCLEQFALELHSRENWGLNANTYNTECFKCFKRTYDEKFWRAMTSRFIKEKIVTTWKPYRQQ